MCGRYSITTPVEALRHLFGFEGALPNLKANYNVAPTHGVPVVRLEHGQRRLAMVRWGLVPPWIKDITQMAQPLINARAETVSDKPAFKGAFRYRRCLVPADGFYEWQVVPGQPKQPYNIVATESAPFAMAGIWEEWLAPDGSELDSLAVLTVGANKALKPIHQRMPVIVQPEDYEDWINPGSNLKDVATLLRPAPDGFLRAYPVSTRVNSVTNDDVGLLEPCEEPDQKPGEQGRLF